MGAPIEKQYKDVAAELRKRLEGEVKFDRYTLLLYSTDASIYQIEPIGVVVPRHKGDVQAAIEVANRFQVADPVQRGRHFACGAGGGPGDRGGFLQVHAKRPGGKQGRALVPGATRIGARRVERPCAVDGPSIWTGYLDFKSRHHRGNDWQQLCRRPFTHLW